MSLNKFLFYVKFRLEEELIKVCPVDKGLLRNSITVTYNNDGIVIEMAEYWKYVEYGTGPHIIRPRNKKSLRWNKKKGSVAFKDDDIFAKEVKHPGTDPQPFLRNTLYHKLPGILQEGANKYLDGADAELSFT